jgi:hypothetical protein
MAGLFDFLMQQGQGQPGGGLLGGVGSYLNNNQDAMVALGLGLAGGATPMEGFKGGMQGFLQGRKSDQSRVAGEQFIKEMGLGVAPSAGPFSKPSPALTQPPAAAGAAPTSNFGNAIAGIESGGKYDALGPVTSSGDRAFGKYQVMGANIPEWTKAHLGQSMTPEQFLANPQAQDAVFNGQFGQYAKKYGPEGAARAWFAGEGGMNNPNARDQLGTTVQAYGDRFTAGMGQQPQAPVQVAQAGGGAIPMATAQPAVAPPAAPQPAGPGVQPVPQDQLGAIRNLPITTVMKWAMNENLPPAQKEVAQKIFAARLEDTKYTEKQKDYLWAQAGGNKQSRVDFLNPPKFEDTGQRDQYDRPIKGFVNANDQTISIPGGTGMQPNTNTPIANVTELRKEVQGLPSYKNVTTAAPVYNSMVEAVGRDNRASDVNMIYGMAKLMDPGSVVREGEMTIAQAVATLPQQLQATVMSQLSGSGRLSPEVRTAIMGEAHSRMNAYHQMFKTDAKMYRGILERQKMNPADVLPQLGPFDKVALPASPATPPPAPPTPNPYEQEMRRRGLLK